MFCWNSILFYVDAVVLQQHFFDSRPRRSRNRCHWCSGVCMERRVRRRVYLVHRTGVRTNNLRVQYSTLISYVIQYYSHTFSFIFALLCTLDRLRGMVKGSPDRTPLREPAWGNKNSVLNGTHRERANLFFGGGGLINVIILRNVAALSNRIYSCYVFSS